MTVWLMSIFLINTSDTFTPALWRLLVMMTVVFGFFFTALTMLLLLSVVAFFFFTFWLTRFVYSAHHTSVFSLLCVISNCSICYSQYLYNSSFYNIQYIGRNIVVEPYLIYNLLQYCVLGFVCSQNYQFISHMQLYLLLVFYTIWPLCLL